MKEEIASVDWSSFTGPPTYDAESVPSALYSLIELDDSSKAEEVGNGLMNALGNNHAGVYYPVLLKALDFIIAIANRTNSKACKICALAVINDFYYFEPDVEGYGACTAEELKKAVLEKLAPYSDESIEF
ncbi:hypothetical protein [Reinekea sp. G2M2-21]|uniref:hypothetical protein n=1 Tax=Reinekea sp. G2M2-21 TaxID=2788942 RepID=UPI0018AA3FA6|nr:hypothetical protein [Reinekea sp. G2M2-21]